ncbi:MAG: hypothetical protein J07HN6_02710 [Halonotius sp. J07HN6]|nr:MAG: hypothetical protein J07HN6_02710 [Halonotius sp. J07HN6]
MTDAESGSPQRQLVVGADLTLESDRADVSISTADGTLVVAVESIGGLFALYDLQERVTGSAGEWLPTGDELPDETPLVFNAPAEIRLRGHTVARYDPDGSAGLLGRLTGVTGVAVAPAGVLRALAAEAVG